MAENQAWQGISCLADLSAELLMTIFDYLSSIEILATFFNLNERLRLIIYDYLQTGDRLIHFNFNHTDFVTYQLFCRDILPQFQSTITSFQLGSDYHFGQIDSFTHYPLCRLDSLTLRLTDPTALIETLQAFLSFNRLRWFDRIHLILNEEAIGWNEKLPFCVQSIPVRHLSIKGPVPYVFAQHTLTGCYTITHLTIDLKFDHDLLPLLYYLPNLIACNARVTDRGRDISNDLSLLAVLPHLKHFQYEGMMSSIHLRRLILEINGHLTQLSIYTQDHRWPFHPSEGFSSDFFDRLPDLRTFHFYIRLNGSGVSDNLTSYFTESKHLLDSKRCHNIACVQSKEVGQIFSVPFAFEHLEIVDDDFFHQIQYFDEEQGNHWTNIQHVTLNSNIYHAPLLTSLNEHFTRLHSIDYQVPHWSLNPQDYELCPYDIQLTTIRKLHIRDSVKHGCQVPQPLFLLTPNLVELDMDHFYLMQIISMASQQTQARIQAAFASLRRLTVRQFDERVSEYFFSYFSHVRILALIFATYKMQVYRYQLPFLGHLLQSMPNLISLKLEHLKKPQEYLAFIEMKSDVREKLADYCSKKPFWLKWYADRTQKSPQYTTLLFST